MRKLLLSLAIALGAISVSAQEAGSIWVGGTVGFNYTDVETPLGDGSTTSFTILPEIGYILSDNIGIGTSLGFTHTEASIADSDESSDADGFVFAPFLRYTFLKGSMGALFVDTGVDYIYLKGSGDVKTTAINAGFKPGVAFSLTENIALIGKFGHFGYTNTNIKSGSTTMSKSNSFGFNIDMSNIQLGAVLTF